MMQNMVTKLKNKLSSKSSTIAKIRAASDVTLMESMEMRRMFATLGAGDVLITGINPTAPDKFTFVVLVSANASQVINFSDSFSDGTTIGSNEGTVIYTAPSTGLAAGTKVVISSADTTPSASLGGATKSGSFNLANGDNLTAFTGTAATPTFLYAVTTSGTAFLASGASSQSGNMVLPAALTLGTSAVAVGNTNYATYNEANGTSGSIATLRTLVSTASKWTTSTGTAPTYSTSDFTIASGATVSIAGVTASQNEGNSGSTAYTFTVSRTDGTGTASVDWAVTGSGTNAADATDFVGGVLPSGTVSFANTETSKTVTVNVQGDTTVEPTETFLISLSSTNISNLTLSPPTSVTGTITNDDTAVALTTATASVTEGTTTGGTLTFTVTRSGLLTGTSSVGYSVAGSGTNPADAADFIGGTLPSGTVSFAASATTATITININPDSIVEPDETFTLSLVSPVGATITGTSSIGTILNDDSATNLSIAATNASQPEGTGSSTPFTFTVTRSGVTSAAGTVDWAVTGSGTNPANSTDFTGGTLPSGTLSFAANEVSKVITVSVNGDTTIETDETFTVTISNPSSGSAISTNSAIGTILNDDRTVSLSATSATLAEGNSGNTPFTFTVTRAAGDLSVTTTVDWAVTGSGTNPADASDFAGGVLPSGTVSFAPSETSKVITINVVGDTIIETNETFLVTLSNANGGTVISNATATGTINNDDYGTLTAGQVVISGYNTTTSTDQVAITPLVNLVPYQSIVVTDNGWNGSTSLLGTNEGSFTYTAPSTGVTRGTKIVFQINSSTATILSGPGTVSSSGTMALAAGGENLLVYTGVSSSPNFLFALLTTGNFQSTGTTVATSATYLPSSLLTTPNSYISVSSSTADNAQYNGTTTFSSATTALAAISTASNWTINNSAQLTLSTTSLTFVSQTTPTVTLASNTKIYDGSAFSPTASATDGTNPTDTTAGNFSYTYYSGTGGVGSVISAPTNAGSYSLAVNYLGNIYYNAVPSTVINFSITQKALSATPVGVDKVYDGITAATLTYNLSGIVGSDVVSATGAGTFDTASAGTGKTVTPTTIILAGAALANYSVTLPTATTTANITQKSLTAAPVGVGKVYDGNTAATLTYNLSGIVGSDVVLATGAGTFDSASAGTGKTVTPTSIVLAGAELANYSVNLPTATTTANVTQKSLTASITASNKPYDGNTSAAVTYSLAGIVGSDVVLANGTATFSDSAVGTAKTVTAIGISLTGADAGNYSVNTSATTTADITAVNPTWLSPTGSFSWSGGTLTVYGNATIIADPALDAPSIVLASSSAHLTINAAGAAVNINTITDTDGLITVTSGTPVIAGAVSITGTGTIDLTSQSAIFRSMTESDVHAMITSGFNGGDWLGTGITSSNAANDNDGVTAVGYANNNDLGASDYNGVPLGATDTIVKYTYYGDADLSGTVTLEDFTQFLVGYQQGGTPNWINGDFDYSGTVTLEDFSLFLAGYQGPNTPLAPAATESVAHSLFSDTPITIVP